MGIRGLTTYIARHSSQYLEPFELHDTYLVIDGNSIASQLYNWHARCNCAFGGDYDKYAQCVREFFDDLIKCKIVPLVLIDGGYEDKKIKTVYVRLKAKIQMASYFTPAQRSTFFPLLMKEVFKDVMDEKGIRYAQCAFEADDEIAAVAKILDCPVLSYDSDFFVYGVLYVPFDTLDTAIVRSSKANGFVKRCKIFRVEKFLDSFKGLDKSLLPLVATLLGNDYIKRSVFKKFFQNLKLSKLTKKNHNEQQRRISGLLNWLQPYTLNGAVAAVLLRIRKEQRRRILRKMEAVIDSYINFSPHTLIPLGFSEEYVKEVKLKKVGQPYKFQGDLYNLETVLGTKNEEQSFESEDDENVDDNDDCDDDDDDDDEDDNEDDNDNTSESDEIDSSTKSFLTNIAPAWFIVEYSKGKFPAYFIDMMYRQLYFCPPQIEDYFYPASHWGSANIISVIFELLTSAIKDLKKNLEYVVRNQNNRGSRYQLKPGKDIFACSFPSLKDLNTLPVKVKAEILTKTLNTPREFDIDQVLPEWRLYFLTIIYWAQQEYEPLVTNCHIYSLICTMLFGVIDQRIGFYRSEYKFNKKYNHKIRMIEKQRATASKPQQTNNIDMTCAVQSVTVDDCIIAAPFFMSNYNVDPKTSHNPKAFNITTVHSFAQFQSCLRHSMHLNALLGSPYLQPKIAEVYNGTMLYNLYNNFKKRNNIEDYVNFVLKNSPSLLQVFNLLSTVIKQPLANIFINKVNQKRKRKHRNRSKKLNVDEPTSYISEDDYDDHSFKDPNNPFCILNAME